MQNYYRKHQGKRKSVIIKVAHKNGQKNFISDQTETAYQINRNQSHTMG
jgi:hypothetical protein